MTRRLIAIATAIFVTSGCAYAQVGGMGTATLGIGTTSRNAAGSSGSDHDHVWSGFRNRQPLVLAVEHFDAGELATGRPDDSDGFNRTEQSGSQPGPVSGNGQHGAISVFGCLLIRTRMVGSS